MSTDYRVTGKGRRLTKGTLDTLCAVHGWVMAQTKPGHLTVQAGLDCLHFYSSARLWEEDRTLGYNYITQYGANSPSTILGALHDAGYETISEHEEEYWK